MNKQTLMNLECIVIGERFRHSKGVVTEVVFNGTDPETGVGMADVFTDKGEVIFVSSDPE